MFFSKLIILSSIVFASNDDFLKNDWKVDDDGDEVLELNNTTISKINSMATRSNLSLYSNGKDQSEAEKKILSELGKTKVFKTYIVYNGDTLRKISHKLYGTDERWKEIYYLNKAILAKNRLTVGMELNVRSN